MEDLHCKRRLLLETQIYKAKVYIVALLYIVALSHCNMNLDMVDDKSGIQKFNGEDFVQWKVQIIDMLVSKDLYETLEDDPPVLALDA